MKTSPQNRSRSSCIVTLLFLHLFWSAPHASHLHYITSFSRSTPVPLSCAPTRKSFINNKLTYLYNRWILNQPLWVKPCGFKFCLYKVNSDPDPLLPVTSATQGRLKMIAKTLSVLNDHFLYFLVFLPSFLISQAILKYSKY